MHRRLQVVVGLAAVVAANLVAFAPSAHAAPPDTPNYRVGDNQVLGDISWTIAQAASGSCPASFGSPCLSTVSSTSFQQEKVRFLGAAPAGSLAWWEFQDSRCDEGAGPVLSPCHTGNGGWVNDFGDNAYPRGHPSWTPSASGPSIASNPLAPHQIYFAPSTWRLRACIRLGAASTNPYPIVECSPFRAPTIVANGVSAPTPADPATGTVPGVGGSSSGASVVPCFTSSPSSPAVGATVTFDPSCTTVAGTTVGYQWDYGDGTELAAFTSAAAWSSSTTTHAYAAAKCYVVTFRLRTSAGNTTEMNASVCVGGSSEPNPRGLRDCSTFDVPCQIENMMRKLFVPEEDLGARFTSLQTAIAGHYPVGPVVWGATTFHDAMQLIAGNKCVVITDVQACDTDWNILLPFHLGNGGGDGTIGEGIHLHLLDPNDHDLDALRNLTTLFSRVAIVFGVIGFVFKLFGSKLGGDAEAGE